MRNNAALVLQARATQRAVVDYCAGRTTRAQADAALTEAGLARATVAKLLDAADNNLTLRGVQ